jgi:hypothetical protein
MEDLKIVEDRRLSRLARYASEVVRKSGREECDGGGLLRRPPIATAELRVSIWTRSAAANETEGTLGGDRRRAYHTVNAGEATGGSIPQERERRAGGAGGGGGGREQSGD